LQHLGLCGLPQYNGFLKYLTQGNTIPKTKEQLRSENAVDPQELDAFWPQWKAQWIKAGFFRQ
jgi:hypothetical protein